MRRDLGPLFGMPRHATGSLLMKTLQPEKAAEVKAMARLVPVTPLPFHYSLKDLSARTVLAWAKAYWHNRIGRKHPFQSYKKSTGVYHVNNLFRVSLAGDWGAGTDEAYEVGKQIEAFQPHCTIHLGDVYYVGDQEDTNANFLGIADGNYDPCKWPSGSVLTLALSGNHEMYARGFSYFDSILPALGQEASFFCLENDNWRIIGLDTAYNSIGVPLFEHIFKPECQLTPEQMQWLDGLEADTPCYSLDDEKATILLTHHQYYSAFEDNYTACAEQLAEFITRPVLWFWGHEHRMAIYDKYASTNGIEAYGRCIGHGGMPIELNSPVKHKEVPLQFTDTRAYPNNEGLHVGYNGHADLYFAGSELVVKYRDLRGTVVRSETWTSNKGELKLV